jgi:hypothetical protein
MILCFYSIANSDMLPNLHAEAQHLHAGTLQKPTAAAWAAQGRCSMQAALAGSSKPHDQMHAVPAAASLHLLHCCCATAPDSWPKLCKSQFALQDCD